MENSSFAPRKSSAEKQAAEIWAGLQETEYLSVRRKTNFHHSNLSQTCLKPLERSSFVFLMWDRLKNLHKMALFANFVKKYLDSAWFFHYFAVKCFYNVKYDSGRTQFNENALFVQTKRPKAEENLPKRAGRKTKIEKCKKNIDFVNEIF